MTRYRNPWHRPGDRRTPAFYTTEARPVAHAGHLVFQRVRGRVWDVVKGDVCVSQLASLRAALQVAERLSLATENPQSCASMPAATWRWSFEADDGRRESFLVDALDPRDAVARGMITDKGMALARAYAITTGLLVHIPANNDPDYAAADGSYCVTVELTAGSIASRLALLTQRLRARIGAQPDENLVPPEAEVLYLWPDERTQYHRLVALLERQGKTAHASATR